MRREKCPAWNHICDKCDVKGHYATACYECQDCDSWGHKSKKSRWCTKSDNTPQKKDIEGGAITAHLAFITQQVSTTSNPKALKLATMSSKKRGNTVPYL